MVNVIDIYNFLSIDDTLSTSGQPSETQIRTLAGEGFNVIINLGLHDDPRYSLKDEKGLVEGLGMVYVHIPVQFDSPREDDLLAFFQAMETHKDKKILIHCAANMRVTAFLGLYRAIKQRKAEIEAFKPMRSVWEPNEVWSLFISNMIAKHTVVSPSLDSSEKYHSRE
jgi:protein tyrosine phosphatase (PTP) superfamily phosphohydrolase (DUF442 family)